MRSVVNFVVALAFMSMASAAHADDLPPDLKTKTDSFFTLLKKNDVPGAYDLLFQGTLMATQKVQDMQVLNTQTKSVLGFTGPITGWELMSVKQSAPSFTSARFIAKTDTLPLFFKFEFYKPRDTWTTYKVTYFDDISKVPE